jgi:hypothetical protein
MERRASVPLLGPLSNSDRDPNQVKEAGWNGPVPGRTKDELSLLCGTEIALLAQAGLVRRSLGGGGSGDANQGREMTVGVREYEQRDLARAGVQR